MTDTLSPPVSGGSRTGPSWTGALSAAVGVAVSLGFAEVISAIAGPSVPSPVVAVADIVVDRAPGSAVRTGIDIAGSADKPLLLLAVVLGSLAVASVAGRWAVERRMSGRSTGTILGALFAVFGLVALLAALRQPATSLPGSLPAYLAAAAAGLGTARGLISFGRAAADPPPAPHVAPPPSRARWIRPPPVASSSGSPGPASPSQALVRWRVRSCVRTPPLRQRSRR